jgi:predicted DnaQ family exonuclease/DinG family helicase
MAHQPAGLDFVAASVQLGHGDPPPIGAITAVLRQDGRTVERLAARVAGAEPVPYHRRLLEPQSFGAAAESLDHETLKARLGTLVRGRPLVHAGGPAVAHALNGALGIDEDSLFSLDELLDLFHPELPVSALASRAALLGLRPESAESDEAELAALTFERLVRDAQLLEPRILGEIVQRSAVTAWPLRHFFRSVLADSAIVDADPLTAGIVIPKAAIQEVAPPEGRRPNDVGAAEGVVDTLARATADIASGYEPRPQQVEMVAAVTAALGGDFHLLVEAGTGTGKSLAYLLPAACQALRSNQRVVISTNTINLQEQLAQKDIPAVRSLLCEYGPDDLRGRAQHLRSTALKGRRNYLCLQRLAALRRAPVLTDVEARFLVKVLIWLSRGGGDRAGLRLEPEEEQLWTRFSADGSTCFAGANPFVRNGSCQLLQARRRAEASHLVVVNHSLLLSDLAADRHILPSYDRLIVDEAHNLEDVATEQFGFHTGQGEVMTLLDAVFARGRDRESGLIVDVRSALQGGEQDADRDYVERLLKDMSDRADRARLLLPETFGMLVGFAHRHGAEESDYDRRLLLTRGMRAQPEWTQVELAWENLRLALLQIEDSLDRLGVALAERSDSSVLDRESLLSTVSSQGLALRILREGMESVLNRHDDQRIAWLTVNRNSGNVTVASAPLNVGDLLETYLFGRRASVVVTSATLSTNGNFDYVRGRLGLAEAEELALGSPFDYQRAALLLLPASTPEPSSSAYQGAIEDAIVELCMASAGRALALFTSHSAVRTTYRAIRGRLAAAGLRLLAQGIDGPPEDLIKALRSDRRTVVLGTASFWEGVDVVGDALSLLIIAKLPFSVPADPIFAARAELFDDPFREYALPQAVLRFKQGFGRLIRHQDDRGVVAVLDRRILSKSYGRIFLRSLPQCTVRQVHPGEAGAAVAAWLDPLRLGLTG